MGERPVAFASCRVRSGTGIAIVGIDGDGMGGIEIELIIDNEIVRFKRAEHAVFHLTGGGELVDACLIEAGSAIRAGDELPSHHSGGIGELEFDTGGQLAHIGTDRISRAIVGGDGERGGFLGLSLDVVPIAGKLFTGEQVDTETTARFDDGEGGKGIVEFAGVAGALQDIRQADRIRFLLGQPVVARRQSREGNRGRRATRSGRSHGAVTLPAQRFERKGNVLGAEIAGVDQGFMRIDRIVPGITGIDIDRQRGGCVLGAHRGSGAGGERQ